MSSGDTCRECGAVIPADSPERFCAQCLLGLGSPAPEAESGTWPCNWPNGLERECLQSPRAMMVWRWEQIEKLNRLIESGPFEVHVARTFPLEKAADATANWTNISWANWPCVRSKRIWDEPKSGFVCIREIRGHN